MDESIVAEEWRPVVGYEGWYSISNHGGVRSELARMQYEAGRIMIGRENPDGYREVVLYKHGTRVRKSIHRLVCESFIGARDVSVEVNHKNGVKDDNRLENLEYVSRSENQQHRFRVLGGKPCTQPRPEQRARGSRHAGSIMSDAKVLELRARFASGEKARKMANEYGIKVGTVYDILSRRSWTHI